MTPKQISYEHTANTLIKAFNKRRMEAYYCATSKEAREKVLELIEDNSSISWGGSMTLSDIELFDELEKGNYTLYDRSIPKTPEELKELYHKALNVDYYLMSSNAITLDGKLVNIDGRGNRIAALIYGPKNVIVVAGMNKVVRDETAALQRIGDQASPPNAIRLNRNTPCAKTGQCHDCLSEDSMCAQILTTRFSNPTNRIKIILVGEELGY